MATLVTGATGFVCLNIVEELVRQGVEVIAYGLGGWPDEAADLLAAPNLVAIDGDVRDAAALDRVFGTYRIERIVHGAAITAGVEREMNDPGLIIDVNVRGVAIVVEAAQRHGIGRFVHLSSGSAYGEAAIGGSVLHEAEAASSPVTLYGLTKYAGERTALRLASLYGMDLVCARLGTVFGPWERTTGARDHVSMFLQLARLAADGETALLPPTARTDFVYSRDVALGVAALLEARTLTQPMYHLSSGIEWADPIADWCRTLKTRYEGFRWRHAQKGEEPSLGRTESRDRARMDVSSIERDAGFVPQYDQRAAYDDYLEWLTSRPGWLQPERAVQHREELEKHG